HKGGSGSGCSCHQPWGGSPRPPGSEAEQDPRPASRCPQHLSALWRSIRKEAEILRGMRQTHGSSVMKVLLLLALPLVLAAADGVVTNQTTGKPQANAAVSLLQMTQQGPQPIENTHTGLDGKFALTRPIPPGGMGPLLVQVTYQGVQYNKVIPPGQPT